MSRLQPGRMPPAHQHSRQPDAGATARARTATTGSTDRFRPAQPRPAQASWARASSAPAHPARPREALFGLQSRVGNRRARQIVQARLRPGSPTDQRATDQETARPAGGVSAGATLSGPHSAAPRPTAGGLRQSGQAGGPRQSGTAEEKARYTTTDASYFPFSRLPKGIATDAATAAGVVTFTSTNVRFALAGENLQANLTSSELELGAYGFNTGSAGFYGGADVTATGPAARVGEYTAGVLQTVFASSRRFYYKPHNAPAHGTGVLISDIVPGLPVRDGFQGSPPWVSVNPGGAAQPFDALGTSQKNVWTIDAPNTSEDWTTAGPQGQEELVKTEGEDRFRTWIAVKRDNAQHAIALNYADWKVNYQTRVTYDDQRPANSDVRVTTNSGAQITGQGGGAGWSRRPRLNDPTANHNKTVTTGTWTW